MHAGLSAPLFWRCLRSTGGAATTERKTIGTAIGNGGAYGQRARGSDTRKSLLQQRRAAVQTVPPAAVSYELLNTVALALVVRQGRVDLGVCHGRGLSSARGTAKTKAPEMPVYLGTR